MSDFIGKLYTRDPEKTVFYIKLSKYKKMLDSKIYDYTTCVDHADYLYVNIRTKNVFIAR